LQAWAERLEEPLREAALTIVNARVPHQYLYRQEAEQCARLLRTTQARQRHILISQQIGLAEDDAERARLLTLLSELQRYMVTLNTPRRITTFPDARDTLGKE
jgi:DNA primase